MSFSLYFLERSLSTTDMLKELQTTHCKCPGPLVVPDAVDTDTVSKGVCCSIRCEGLMATDSEISLYHRLEFWLSLIGVN
mmetsp:Transcript_13057/g.16237  ORF Transcript_13057/g.16237 Transcript_13057/m.16237 type:complete len:80 (-) Transcript_13057:2464-2703(-)